jgi:hypothetical protein
MKTKLTVLLLSGISAISFSTLADSLPVITAQPQNLTNSGTFAVVSGNATAFQWRCNGIAQVVAGPEVDQMQAVGDTWDFSDVYPWWPDWYGYFDWDDQFVPSVSPGQTVYYRVDLTYPVPSYVSPSGYYTQPSKTLKLVAGGEDRIQLLRPRASNSRSGRNGPSRGGSAPGSSTVAPAPRTRRESPAKQ